MSIQTWTILGPLVGTALGAGITLIAGPLQVRKAANAEHGQWLRNERQKTYVDLLAAWDDLAVRTEDRVLTRESIEIIDHENSWHEASEDVTEAMRRDRAPFQRVAERAQMLGLDAVEQAIGVMLGSLGALEAGITAQYSSSSRNAFWEAQELAKKSRSAFLAASKAVLRSTPLGRRR